MTMPFSRRGFVKGAAAVGGTAAVAALGGSLALDLLKPLPDIPNPLDHYPERGWETVYRDQYRYDSTFSFVCAPNDTHNCRLTAFLRNGVMVRTEQAYDVDTYEDRYGNRA